MPQPILVSFLASANGPWRINRIDPVIGETLAPASRLTMLEMPVPAGIQVDWVLRGATGNTRYTTRTETDALAAVQQGLSRPQATCAALIPIRKSEAWWILAQDERRTILEEQSRHIALGLRVLPGVARRLHHSRELGEPFDFLTWFEYAPEDSDAFEALVADLRATPEWRYVDREVDIRLSSIPA